MESLSLKEGKGMEAGGAQPIWQNLVAGAAARCTAASLMAPFDIVKTRLQFQRQISAVASESAAQRHLYRGVLDAITRIWKEEGFFAFYKGLPVRLIYIAPSAAVSFAIYEQARGIMNRFSQNKQQQSSSSSSSSSSQHDAATRSTLTMALGTLLAGALARIFGTAARTPFDIVKQRLQLPNHDQIANGNGKKGGGPGFFKSVSQTVKDMWKQHGIKSFFQGYGVTLMRDAPFASIYFTSYEGLKAAQQRMHSTMSPASSSPSSLGSHNFLLAGALAGAIATTITIPFDVIKTRLQTQHALLESSKSVATSPPSHTTVQYRGIAHAFTTIYKEEGVRGLTKGLSARLMYIMPSSALTFTCYELYSDFLAGGHRKGQNLS